MLDPIGVDPADWRWRENRYRAKTIRRPGEPRVRLGHHHHPPRPGADRLPLPARGPLERAGASSRPEFIRTATRPTDLPAPYPYYGFYWGSNAKGTLPDVPRDIYWALGLGDSILVVCPSLDIVAVRLGDGNTASQLPPRTDEWEKKVGGLLRAASSKAVVDPYPRSPVDRGGRPGPRRRRSSARRRDSDNWPMTWADDDHLYTAYGDGTGFAPKVPAKLSLGLARVEGGPDDFRGVNLRSPTGEQPKGDGKAGKKASGLLMVDGVLYLWVRNAGNAQLAWSDDHARTWTWADWTFTTSFGCPTLPQLRQGLRRRPRRLRLHLLARLRQRLPARRPPGAGPRAEGPDRGPGRLRVLRGPRRRTAARPGPPTSTDRGAVFRNPGRCYRIQVSYDAGLRRYLLCQTGADAGVRAGFGIYDAPEPWGPWTTVELTDAWDVPPGESCSFPTRWMSDDGKTLHLVFSGDDSFAVRKATLRLAGEGDAPR